MAIKGKSIIELYNSNTRIKHRYEDENIVTNVFKYLFGQNYFAGATQSFMDNFIPFYKKGIGGIILFDDRIEEDPDIVIAPNTVGCTGYASNEAYSGSDLSRGGMNLNETKLIDNGMKFVWDFSTSQANGDIACISLTSAEGGMFGYGSKNYCDYNSMYTIKEIDCEINLNGKFYNTHIINDSILYRAGYGNNNSLILRKYKIYDQEVTLTNYYKTVKLIEEKTINTINSISNSLELKTDGEKIYLVSNNNNNLILIDITNFENIKEYSFVIAYAINSVAIRDDMVYIRTSSKKIEVYSIFDTSAKLNEINCDDILLLSNVNEYIHTGKALIDKGDNIRYIYKGNNIDNVIESCGIPKNKLFLPYIVNETDGKKVKIGYGLPKNYLVTINNIQTPITKTSAQTMKITYTLTEE